MESDLNTRAEHEVSHGRWLAEQETEKVWGWNTPAGRFRAQRRAQRIVDVARVQRFSRVLEIGCGTGLFTEMFAATGARIVAVDISPELLVKARLETCPSIRLLFLKSDLRIVKLMVRSTQSSGLQSCIILISISPSSESKDC